MKLNESRLNVAIDCGCGTGSDIAFLRALKATSLSSAFNPDSISIITWDRFGQKALVEISQERIWRLYELSQSRGWWLLTPGLFLQSRISSIRRGNQIWILDWNRWKNCFICEFRWDEQWLGFAHGYRTSTTPLTRQKYFGRWYVRSYPFYGRTNKHRGQDEVALILLWRLSDVQP